MKVWFCSGSHFFLQTLIYSFGSGFKKIEGSGSETGFFSVWFQSLITIMLVCLIFLCIYFEHWFPFIFIFVTEFYPVCKHNTLNKSFNLQLNKYFAVVFSCLYMLHSGGVCDDDLNLSIGDDENAEIGSHLDDLEDHSGDFKDDQKASEFILFSGKEAPDYEEIDDPVLYDYNDYW